MPLSRAQRQQRVRDRRKASRYAHLIEYGSSRQAAQPFLRPALDEKSHEVIQVMADAMRSGIEREVRRTGGVHGGYARR
jgi:HK97 gp10 family phage protein